MWSRRDCAAALVAATIFLTIGLLLFPAPAQPATGHDAELAAWYLKGEADSYFGLRGWTVSKLTCVPARGAYVTCAMQLNSPAASSVCNRGRFQLLHFAVVGQMLRVPCGGAPPS